MKRFNSFLFCILIAVILSISTTFAQVNSNFSLLKSDIVFSENNGYDEISIDGSTYTDDIGKPKLPVFTETFVLPYDAVVTDIQVTVTSSQTIQGKFYIIPAQPPQLLDGSDPPAFVEPDLSVYSSNQPYPNKTVEIVDDSYMYGYQIVTVNIFPISYIPASGEIYLQNYNFTLNYTISNRTNSVQQQSLRRAELTKNFIKKHC